MILFKYVDFDTAIKILSNNKIAFTKANQFNDVLEMHASRGINCSADSRLKATIQTQFNMSFAALSLTRNPTNKLMWSHYANQHKGIVIGINVIEANLCCDKTNVVPACYGDIVYTKTFPQSHNIDISSSNQKLVFSSTSHNFSTYELFKKAYLYKSLDWAYEEEVRIVKNIRNHPLDNSNSSNNNYSNKNGTWEHQKVSDNRDLFLYQLPPNSIQEVYFGSRVHGAAKHEKLISLLDENVEIKYCCLQDNSYELFIGDYYGNEIANDKTQTQKKRP